MESKLVFNMLLGLPAAWLAMILFSISFAIKWDVLVMMMVLGATFSFLISTFGSILNLYLPKFDFINEVEVIKQSFAAVIAIFGSFGWIAINGVIYYYASKSFSLMVTFGFMSMANVLIGLGFYAWMRLKSESLFIKMLT